MRGLYGRRPKGKGRGNLAWSASTSVKLDGVRLRRLAPALSPLSPLPPRPFGAGHCTKGCTDALSIYPALFDCSNPLWYPRYGLFCGFAVIQVVGGVESIMTSLKVYGVDFPSYHALPRYSNLNLSPKRVEVV